GTVSLDLFNLGNESVRANVTVTIYNATGHVVRREMRRTDVQTALSLRERIGGNLSTGRYTMNVSVRYGNRTESAASSFRVVERRKVPAPSDRLEVPWRLLRLAGLAVAVLAVLGIIVIAVRRLWIRRVEGPETGTYTCDDCGREFSSPELYRIHRNRHKAAGAIMSYLAAQEEDSGSQAGQGERSRQSVEVEEEHVCPVCNRSFDSARGLHVHQTQQGHREDDG
ncbi:MAG: C2H2-type zinc finger protein, partial [Candidatus Nanohaloarchaea archaeon]|nr:C2H2-type zinc finger protein [Candidatus Nanohaloarchaea archaeon]